MSPNDWTPELFKAVAEELQRRHGGPTPYWRCSECQGPSLAGAWRHRDCRMVLDLADGVRQ